MSLLEKIRWASDCEFSIDDESFVIDITNGKNRRQSDKEAYTLVKTTDFLNLYHKLEKDLYSR